MIVTVPAFYPARVVLAGRRTVNHVLLSTEVPVRIPDVGAEFGPALRIGRTVLDEMRDAMARETRPREDMEPVEGTYMSDSEGSPNLFSPLRLVGGTHGGRRFSEPLSAAVLEEAGGMLRTSAGRHRTLVSVQDWPFTSREAIASPEEAHGLMPETTSFRSCTPLGDDSRNVAIAHAHRVAASMRHDPATGLVWESTQGPWLAVHGHSIDLEAGPGARWARTSGMADALYRVDQADLARTHAEAMVRLTASTVHVPLFRAEVVRPAAYSWNSAPLVAMNVAGEIQGQVYRRRSALSEEQYLMSQDLYALRETVEDRTTLWIDGEATIGEAGEAAVEMLRIVRDMIAPGWPADDRRASQSYRSWTPLALLGHVVDMAERFGVEERERGAPGAEALPAIGTPSGR